MVLHDVLLCVLLLDELVLHVLSIMCVLVLALVWLLPFCHDEVIQSFLLSFQLSLQPSFLFLIMTFQLLLPWMHLIFQSDSSLQLLPFSSSPCCFPIAFILPSTSLPSLSACSSRHQQKQHSQLIHFYSFKHRHP